MDTRLRAQNFSMRLQTRGLFSKHGASVFGGLVLFSAFLFGGGSRQPEPRVVVAMVGETVVLPCHLDSPADASALVVEWARPDLDPGFVHVWRDRKELLDFKQPSFQGRTSLSVSQLKLGDVSLQVSGVRLSDAGTYRCLVPALGQESFVKLIVASAPVSVPTIVKVSDTDGGLVLECRSSGWFPEPELLWLDAEGNLLSAGPTETVRGSDDLYTVSSRVTVEKRHSSRYTCRVQQRTSNQAREDHLTLKNVSSLDSMNLMCSILIILVLVGVAAAIYWINKGRTHFNED